MQLNLRATIILAVIGGLLLPVSIGAFFILHRQEQALSQQFLADHQRLVEILAIGIQGSLWNMSPATGQPLVDSVLGDQRVVSVTVTENNAGVFLARTYPERRKARQFQLQRNVEFDGHLIGSVSLEMDTHRLDEAAADYRRIFIITLVGQLVLSLALILALLHVRLLNPLKRLMLQAKHLARREYAEPFVWERSDEIGELGRILEGTRQALQELFRQLEEKNRQLQQDIERRTLIEQELKRHCDHLEELVSERTEVLAQRSQELARSNTELEQMAYVASHDLQEPLRMVGSYMQLLEKRYKDRLDADADEFIGYAVDGAKRMQDLINDLLAFSRIGTKVKPLSPVDCDTVMSAVLKNLRIAIMESNATVRCGPLPTVMGDNGQIVQLFQNLIANAIKFRREEPPQVDVDARPENGFWHFSVRDNGIGIAAEYFDRIFILFQRLHARKAYPGTGIGLAMCKKIVERHGGRIWVESEPGQGSVFQFTLPRSAS